MQLYAHWLDGEFVRRATDLKGPNQATDEMTRALKLHALLGTQFVLNDIQIFDSAAVLNLFRDADFREFLSKNRDFFDLRVDPARALGTDAFSLATTGLVRAGDLGWSSSLFVDDPTPVKLFANDIVQEISKESNVRVDTVGDALKKYPEHREHFVAMRHAIRYFGIEDIPKLIAPPGLRISYFDVLQKTRNKLHEQLDTASLQSNQSVITRNIFTVQIRQDLENIEDTLIFIERVIKKPDERNKRSAVLERLRLEPNVLKRQIIWNNVVQAWNFAAQNTIQPDGSSVGNLPGAVSMAPYLQQSTDVLVPLEANSPIRLAVKAERIPKLPIDIDTITWRDVAKVRSETAETMKQLTHYRYQNPISMNEINEATRLHLEAVSKILKPSKKSSGSGLVRSYGFSIIEPGSAAAVVALFGPPPYNYIALGATAMTVSTKIWNAAIARGEPQRQQKAFTGTLMKAVLGSNK
jgi:hypothetical protein